MRQIIGKNSPSCRESRLGTDILQKRASRVGKGIPKAGGLLNMF